MGTGLHTDKRRRNVLMTYLPWQESSGVGGLIVTIWYTHSFIKRQCFHLVFIPRGALVENGDERAGTKVGINIAFWDSLRVSQISEGWIIAWLVISPSLH